MISPFHITAFYAALHRQHYPDLPTFVANYYKFENGETSSGPTVVRPLKNRVSTKKNRNKSQLPRKFLDFLQEDAQSSGFVTVTSRIEFAQTSADRSTTKLAVQLHDGQLVESVLMRYVSTATSNNSRASLCVSSQCGCAMGCTFCATGTMGLSGNLTAGEILEQIPLPKLDLVRNVVFMGMGEPLDNYSNVVEACRALIDRQRWNLAHGRVTVSTVGLVSQIRKLTAELPEVSLALSLHAPNQQDRQAIVPTAKHYPLEDLIDALDQHMMAYLQKRTNPMIEYVMLEGPTSTLECAHQLGKLCENRHLVVNLIPYNQTNVRDVLRCPSREHMEEFREIVVSYGSFCTIRKTMGADIDSACGQLITLRENKQSQNEHNAKGDVKDIEDGGSGCGGGTKQQALATSSGGSVRRKVEVAEVLGKGQLSDHSACSHIEQGVNLEAWIRPLALATTLAGSCFMISIALAIRQRRRQ
ncbi:predicted protein [Phaeodactylum tricornutum CCAP 1055/1]|uniref:Radical SAM core domain-containing protein n=3 Tax=Phaeodactylum tricornutum TaxID=2850 RepID=B7S3M1_PHATC|nr:predicted protein [Phaeodactylum tricornutum CCAP 1055/1]EEC42868.1 predicted protein [Phaeodactylum tricornutum CCAP 1055/1]|eukprot:XP_002176161.1 predicted protein [Phaeodactylum tricornutum CCAP 1055/1]